MDEVNFCKVPQNWQDTTTTAHLLTKKTDLRGPMELPVAAATTNVLRINNTNLIKP